MINYFTNKKGLNYKDVFLNYHVLGAQRNCCILGVFSRKFTRDNDNRYLQYIPLVIKYLEYDLSHPQLAKLQAGINKLK